MATAAWIAAIVTTLCWVLVLKLTVRVFGRGADNGWDNAIAYTVVSVLLLLPAKWMLGSKSYLLIALAPAVIWIGQTIAIKVVYQVKSLHAMLIGATHAVATTTIVTTIALVAGVVAAYVLYGRIVSDPMILIRLILRLIGLWPHDIALD